jgi:hypothetical protein
LIVASFRQSSKKFISSNLPSFSKKEGYKDQNKKKLL